MPENTEMPACRSTVVRMSSMMSTVLPTPAPPNIAALPPWTSGANRSMDLMPVWKRSRAALRRASAGAAAWMGRRSIPAGSGGPRSVVSPRTFNRRPSTGWPTGTVTGRRSRLTGVPRFRPPLP